MSLKMMLIKRRLMVSKEHWKEDVQSRWTSLWINVRQVLMAASTSSELVWPHQVNYQVNYVLKTAIRTPLCNRILLYFLILCVYRLRCLMSYTLLAYVTFCFSGYVSLFSLLLFLAVSLMRQACVCLCVVCQYEMYCS